MADYSIKLTLPNVSDVQKVFNQQVYPLLAQAVRAIAQEAAHNWIDAINVAPLWSGEKQKYIQSIRIDYWADGLRADVISDYKYASEIENGRPPRDLKPMLLNSPKVRRTKDGKRFLVVPFRHNSPGNTAHAPAMPPSVYALASQMKMSAVTGTSDRAAGEVTLLSPASGMTPAPVQTPYLSSMGTKSTYLVAQNNYKWGGRLTRKALAEAGASKEEQRRYGGMVRMKEATGGSSYLTFRVVMEGSSGWVIPAQPGLYLAKDVAEHLQPVAEAAIAEAMRREGISS
jgi:hypothetical protein